MDAPVHVAPVPPREPTTDVTPRFRARIFRFDPATDATPRFDAVEVPCEPHMRVLDVLDHAVEECGLSIGYRYFCGIKRCGMCGVNVNGKAVLACWEAATPDMVIEPLGNMPVIRDLIVDRSAFEQATVDLEPRLVRKTPYTSFPEVYTHRDVAATFPLMNCIECYVCSSTCPAVPGPHPGAHGREGQRGFVGPGTLVQIAKVALHPKDELDRSGMLENASIDHCMSCYRCEQVCPVGIPIVSHAIMPLRGLAAKGPAGKARFPLDFADNVRTHVDIHSGSLFVKAKGWVRALASVPLVLRMLMRGKTRLFSRPSARAKREVNALFKAAGS
ncbi:MAG TPA: 2Fe-2S iron-sulfur cluster-binding protein [Burkholderiales bacterium]|nr:2Fe-2S iron-sulfur cluster-binding protein [Burkholderiales bacterium]